MRFSTLLLSILLLALIAAPVFSQSIGGGRNCATEQHQQELEKLYPGLLQEQERLQQQAQQQALQQAKTQHLRQAQATITIPVVFHIVYNTPEENISDEQIYSQLTVLNDDFRRTNADRTNTPSHFANLAGDVNIEFCLASTDPNGDLTTGITRTNTSNANFSAGSRIKQSNRGGVDAWDRNQYLNIWVGNIEDGILGYATMPGSPAAYDGVVLHYRAVGTAPYNPFMWSYNLGRTATHEVGHWLGLEHIWGTSSFPSCSDSDRIADTPNQEKENTRCPSGIKISCDNGPYGDMWQNYMDYVDDACMNLFTKGQAAHMNAIVTSYRASLLTSLACTGGLRANFEAVATDTLIAAGNTVQFRDKSVGERPSKRLWQFEGGTPATSTEKDPVVTYKKPGRFKVTLTITKDDMSSTVTREEYIHVTPSTLTVYPVPASDYIIIEQPAKVELRQVVLITHLGQIALQQEVTTRTAKLDTRNLSAGVYFLRIISSTGTETRKVTILK
jgi:type II secretory pathway pseudopilin PulG